MGLFKTRYFNINRLLMLSVGLWPYQKMGYRRFQMVLICSILVQGLTMQLASFITNEYSVDLLIKVFSFVFLSAVYTFKYNTVYFKSEQVKHLFEQVRYDWHTLIDDEEIEITRKYGNKGRLYTLLAGSIAYCGSLTFLMTVFIPDLLDFIAPLNEPRRHNVPIMFECFVDREKYFYIIILFLGIYNFLGMTVLIAAETFYMICIQHACGLFKLTSYRILNAFDGSSRQMSTPKTKCNACVRLCGAVKIHRRSLEFIECLTSTFSASYFIMCGLAVASLSINLFRFMQAAVNDELTDAIQSGLFIYAHFCYVIWNNYFGQDLIDYSADVFAQTYNAQWYTAPSHVQKMILFILHRSAKGISFSIGSIFVLSLEGFATLVSMSMSYCMLIYSTRT